MPDFSYPPPDTKITLAELAGWMNKNGRNGRAGTFAVVDAGKDILAERKRKENERKEAQRVQADDTQITRRELTAALESKKLYSVFEGAEKTARELVNKVLEARAQFKPGDIVRSGPGSFYSLRDDGRWNVLSGNGGCVSYEYPVRPITKVGVVT